MKTEQYNGWTNYETWLVKLWMDEGGDYWAEQARETLGSAEPDQHFTKSERARLTLADSLKDQHEEAYLEQVLKPARAECSVWSDLLGAALLEVNWHEIAESLLTDYCEGYNKETEAA